MTNRDVLAVTGPSFWHDGDKLMFQFVIDPTNIIGPRPATEADAKAHPQAWAEFERSIAIAPPDPDEQPAEQPAERPRRRTKA